MLHVQVKNFELGKSKIVFLRYVNLLPTLIAYQTKVFLELYQHQKILLMLWHFIWVQRNS